MMGENWYLFGITPPSPETFGSLLQNKQREEASLLKPQFNLQWHPQYSIVSDDEKPGRPLTLLASCKILPHSSLEQLEDYINDENDGDEEFFARRIAASIQEQTPNIQDVELWAMTPFVPPFCPNNNNNNKSYAELLTLHINQEDWESQALGCLRQYGVFHQPKVLDSNQIHCLKQYVDASIDKIETLLQSHRPDIALGQDRFTFEEIASRNQQRFDLRITEPHIHEFVQTNILGDTNSHVCQLLQQSLGIMDKEEIDFDLSVVYSRPGACIQRWHADGAHISKKNTHDSPYAVCLFIPLIHLNRDVGYTQFWPGSHVHPGMIDYPDVLPILTKTEYNGIGNAGDAIWYDYRTIHRGMPNTSSSIIRPVLQVIFKQKWYVEERNYGTTRIQDSVSSKKQVVVVEDDLCLGEEKMETDECMYCSLIDMYPSLVENGVCTCPNY